MIATASPITRRRLLRQSGTATFEYVAMLALAGVLVLALVLVTHPRAGDLASAVGRVFCLVESIGGGSSAGCSVDTRTPYEQATSGRYVAMGDSYSSGEGSGDYAKGTDFDDRDDLWPFNDDEEKHNRCHRSANAYANIVAGGNDFAGGSTFVACSGSVISDFDDPNHSNTGEKPQTDALGKDVSLVTLSIGGNDLGFADVVQDCIVNGGSGLPFTDGCKEKHDQRIKDKLVELRATLIAEYKEIHAKAPNARIIIVGYPQLFVDNPSDSYGNLLYAGDQVWMNQKAAQLNATLASAANQAGVEFVDPTDAFRGHGIGSDDPWINDLDWGGPGFMITDPGSFHPNATGQQALANLVQQQMRHPRP